MSLFACAKTTRSSTLLYIKKRYNMRFARMIGRTVRILFPSTVLAAILVSTAGFSPITLSSSRGRISFTNHPRRNHDDARASSSSSFRSPSSEDDALRLGRSSRRQSSPTAGILRRASLSVTSGGNDGGRGGGGGGGGPGLVTAAFATTSTSGIRW